MRNTTYSRDGLTLIELVVVLTILVALGGVAAATLPNMLNRTHVATVATSLPTIDATIRQNILLNSGQMGNGFDSLVAGAAVADYVNGSGAYAPYALTDEDVAALGDIGIGNLVPAADPPLNNNATFGGHTVLPVDLAAGTNVCTIAAGTTLTDILFNVWNYVPPTGSPAEYIVVGLGQRCSLVGAGDGAFFAEAPLHAVDAHSERADQSYARILLVIELLNPGTADAEARYIGAGAPHPDGIQGVATHLQEWYSSDE